ncbi:MAG: TrmB family transcriptional regulator [Halanaeroarchaeum sp.]
MTVDAEFDPIEALERLGLPNYEARVFVALQKLGTGTAKDVSSVADVPRSQVYGAAESLEARGLLEIQHSTPKTYRPVTLDEAQDRLRERFDRAQKRAFEYLEAVKDERTDAAEPEAGVWRLTGSAAIDDRTAELAEEASSRIVYGTNDPISLSESVEKRLQERAADGVRVVVLSEKEEIADRLSNVAVVPPTITGGAQSGRLLVVDDDTILMSVVEDEEEIAIWSAESGFARVLVPLVEDALSPSLPDASGEV